MGDAKQELGRSKEDRKFLLRRQASCRTSSSSKTNLPPPHPWGFLEPNRTWDFGTSLRLQGQGKWRSCGPQSWGGSPLGMKGSQDHLLGWFPGSADTPFILLRLGPFERTSQALCPADPRNLLSSGPADPDPPQPAAGWPCSRTLGPLWGLAPKLPILICFLTTRPWPDPCSWNLSLHCYIL